MIKMMNKLHWNTVSKELREVLLIISMSKEFADFWLVGGTALSLQRGHRISVDIDMFTDISYDKFDLTEIEKYLINSFEYVEFYPESIQSVGRTFYVGNSKKESVKLDIFHQSDLFVFDKIEKEGVRMVNIKEILAMKLDVIMYNNTRKKDLWDIYEFIFDYSLEEMLSFHEKRFIYTHNREEIIKNFTNFDKADNYFDPTCLRGNFWDVIKFDIVNWINKYK